MQCQQCFEREAEICRKCRDNDLTDYDKVIRKLNKMIDVRNNKIKSLSKTITYLNKNTDHFKIVERR